ncbi:MAG: glycosyltransferase [Patescibacteria group bacterium]
MKILYQIPSLTTIYAGRTIYNGYKNAFLDLGHKFKPYTADDNFKEIMEDYHPDILITGLTRWSLRYLDINLLKKYRKKGLNVLANTPFWRSPLSKLRINETSGLENNSEYVNLIKNGLFADAYISPCEQFDERMAGFEKGTGCKYHTVPLAADKMIIKGHFDNKFKADISFIGTNLPEKRAYFKKYVFPLAKKYNLRLYGQDWTLLDRSKGWVQRFGQYFNIHSLAAIQKPKLQLEDEATIYNSSLISINIHEDYQKKYGGDCNERTFKIPLAGGFEITDNVRCIRQYFTSDEMIVAKDGNDWLQKINYYLKNPEKRHTFIQKARRKVLQHHTYHNRVARLIEIVNII